MSAASGRPDAPAVSRPAVLQCLHVEKRYAGDPALFRGASLDLFGAEAVVLFGPAGSGKTTLLRMMLGIEPVSSGHVLVSGRSLQRANAREQALMRRRLGAVNPDSFFLPDRTAIENVALPLEIAGLPASIARRRAGEALFRVGLSGRAGVAGRALSACERVLSAIARSSVARPLAVLADDPAAGLHPEAAREVMARLFELPVQGMAVLVATSDPGLASGVPGARSVSIHGGLLREGIAGGRTP